MNTYVNYRLIFCICLTQFFRAHEFNSTKGNCAAFLSNYDSNSAVRVMFNNMHYNLPPWSISILPDCKNVVFNTAKSWPDMCFNFTNTDQNVAVNVATQTSHVQLTPTNSHPHSWEYGEDRSSVEDSSTLTAVGLLEQLNITRDTSDYLWYLTSSSESFFRGGRKPTLCVQSKCHAVHAFVNGQLSGSAYGSRDDMSIRFNGPVNLLAGTNRIALVSIAVGLPVSSLSTSLFACNLG